MRLFDVANKSSWVWASAVHAPTDRLVIGCDSGAIDMVQMTMGAVHSLYRDRYAYRENLTEIIVHNLVTDKKVRIKCKDLVQRLALYRNKLAVQLTDRICIYEAGVEDPTDMHFRLRRERVSVGDKACDHMVVAASNLLFVRGNVLELYAFDGFRQRVWITDAPIRCIKVDGGVEGKEAVLMGLESGVVLKLFLDNPFPLELTRKPKPVVNVDISLDRTKLSTVDFDGKLSIIDLTTQEVLYSENDVISGCFNIEVDDMFCYTGRSSIFVLSGLGQKKKQDEEFTGYEPPQPQEQFISGTAIGFQAQKIFCVYRGTIVGVDVPQGQNMMKAIDRGDYAGAYSIACLGSTESDWKSLAMRALRANCTEIAKNSFARLKDVKFLSLIEAMEKTAPTVGSSNAAGGSHAGEGGTVSKGGRVRGNVGTNQPSALVVPGSKPVIGNTVLDPTWQAEILAYEGHHHEAAKTYARAGKLEEAIKLFIDLRRWNDAKMFAQNAGHSSVGTITLQQAKWLQEINDWKGSAELYISLGQHMQAAKIVAECGEEGWADVLLDVVRATPMENKETLYYCGEKFTSSGDDLHAKETYTKLGDVTQLMALYARKHMWAEAAKLADEHVGEFDVSVFLPYGEWLISRDRYEEAMEAYKKAGRSDLAKRVLKDLTHNALCENRFKDAAYHYWMLSKQDDANISDKEKEEQSEWEHKADLYFAYASVHAFITDPFTSHQPEMLFQVSRFIINSLGTAESVPFGISKAATLYTLAKEAMTLGAFKLARHAYDRLGKLQPPKRKINEIELDMLVVQAKPVRDDPDHLPVCYRCSVTNPLLNPFTSKFAKGDVCTNCGHPFVRSFINFDILPLVEFVPETSISDEEAIEMIRQPPSEGRRFGDGWREGKHGEAETMSFDQASRQPSYDDNDYGGADGDLFTRCLNATLENQVSDFFYNHWGLSDAYVFLF